NGANFAPRTRASGGGRISGYYSQQRVGLIAISRRQSAVAWWRRAARGGAQLNEGDGRVYERDEASLADFPGQGQQGAGPDGRPSRDPGLLLPAAGRNADPGPARGRGRR